MHINLQSCWTFCLLHSYERAAVVWPVKLAAAFRLLVWTKRSKRSVQHECGSYCRRSNVCTYQWSAQQRHKWTDWFKLSKWPDPTAPPNSIHQPASHNSFLKRIAGKNHFINSRMRDREPKLTTNETGLSPSQTKQVVEARGVKVLEKRNKEKWKKPMYRYFSSEITGLFSWKREFTCGAVRNIMFDRSVHWLEAVDTETLVFHG